MLSKTTPEPLLAGLMIIALFWDRFFFRKAFKNVVAQRGSLSTKIQAFLPYAPNQCLDQYGIYASVNWINISSGSGLLQRNHYLTQCLLIIYLSIKKKLQLSLNQHTFSLKKMHLNILSMKLRTFRVIPMYWCNVYIYIYIYTPAYLLPEANPSNNWNTTSCQWHQWSHHLCIWDPVRSPHKIWSWKITSMTGTYNLLRYKTFGWTDE